MQIYLVLKINNMMFKGFTESGALSHRAPQSCYDPNKKLSYCCETVRREGMPRIAEMNVEMNNQG